MYLQLNPNREGWTREGIESLEWSLQPSALANYWSSNIIPNVDQSHTLKGFYVRYASV